MQTRTATSLRIPYLYHYRRFDAVQLTRIFTEGTLYCSNPTQFNDPWDCQPCFSTRMLDDPDGRQRVASWFARVGRRRYPQLPEEEHCRRERVLRSDKVFLTRLIENLTADMAGAIGKQYRVFCLTPHPDSALMWAHYAQSHRGICLEFSVQNDLICGALPVQYLDRYPEFDPSEGDLDANLLPLISKSKDWVYEGEFRLVVAAPGFYSPGLIPTVDDFVALPISALKAITIGCLMPEADRQLLRTLVKGAPYPIKLRAAHRTPDRYALEIRPAD